MSAYVAWSGINLSFLHLFAITLSDHPGCLHILCEHIRYDVQHRASGAPVSYFSPQPFSSHEHHYLVAINPLVQTNAQPCEPSAPGQRFVGSLLHQEWVWEETLSCD